MRTIEKEDVVIDDDAMEELIEIAERRGHSLEDVIDKYVHFKMQRRDKLVDLPPDLASLRGKYVVPADFNWKEAVKDKLYMKYNSIQ
jgi:hypothetical protein